jgi:hypothetical protein
MQLGLQPGCSHLPQFIVIIQGQNRGINEDIMEIAACALSKPLSTLLFLPLHLDCGGVSHLLSLGTYLGGCTWVFLTKMALTIG